MSKSLEFLVSDHVGVVIGGFDVPGMVQIEVDNHMIYSGCPGTGKPRKVFIIEPSRQGRVKGLERAPLGHEGVVWPPAHVMFTTLEKRVLALEEGPRKARLEELEKKVKWMEAILLNNMDGLCEGLERAKKDIVLMKKEHLDLAGIAYGLNDKVNAVPIYVGLEDLPTRVDEAFRRLDVMLKEHVELCKQLAHIRRRVDDIYSPPPPLAKPMEVDGKTGKLKGTSSDP